MAKKKKLTKAERKEARLRKGKQWLLTYTGSPKKMNKHYRERFHVDAVTAAKDLQELGVNYTQEQLDRIKRAEEQRLRQRRMEREAKERERLAALYRSPIWNPRIVMSISSSQRNREKGRSKNDYLHIDKLQHEAFKKRCRLLCVFC